MPDTAPLKFTAFVASVLHKVWLATATTSGVGFTVMWKVSDAPVQPLAEGVTVVVAVTGALVVLVAVKEAISPFPLAARPREVLLFVHE